jgi:hypothetical protein
MTRYQKVDGMEQALTKKRNAHTLCKEAERLLAEASRSGINPKRKRELLRQANTSQHTIENLAARNSGSRSRLLVRQA